MVIKIILLVLLYLFIGGIFGGVICNDFIEDDMFLIVTLLWPFVIIFGVSVIGAYIAKTIKKLIVQDDGD